MYSYANSSSLVCFSCIWGGCGSGWEACVVMYTIRRTVIHPRLKLSIHLMILLVLLVENSSPRCCQTVMMRLLRLRVTPVLLRLRHNTRLRFKRLLRLQETGKLLRLRHNTSLCFIRLLRLQETILPTIPT